MPSAETVETAVFRYELDHDVVHRVFAALESLARIEAAKGRTAVFDIGFAISVDSAMAMLAYDDRALAAIDDAGVSPRDVILTLAAIVQGSHMIAVMEEYDIDMDSALRMSHSPIARRHVEYVRANKRDIDEQIARLNAVT